MDIDRRGPFSQTCMARTELAGLAFARPRPSQTDRLRPVDTAGVERVVHGVADSRSNRQTRYKMAGRSVGCL
jgi:hypothetical protein